MQEIKQNNKYQVLSPDGWSDFSCIKKQPVSSTLLFTFNDSSTFQCTENHLIKINESFIEAEWVSVGQKISNKIVISVEYIKNQVDVYDLVDVSLNNEYITNDIISHNCEFLGSSGTLISAIALRSMSFVKPIMNSGIDGLKVYETVKPEHFYVMCVDTSRGKGLDYSAFTVIDCTQMPYRVVATYKDNEISPLVYPAVLKQVGDYFNKAMQFIETNDNGQQIADILFEDYEYENILSTVEMGKKLNKKLVVGWGYGTKSGRGIRTTKSVKRLGCSVLKNLIERQQLIITDYDIISELSTFVSNGVSYEAEEGSHDDLVMCLVLFSWFTNQKFFSDMTNIDIRRKLNEEQLQMIEEELTGDLILAGHVDVDDPKAKTYVEDGMVWTVAESKYS